MREEETEKGWRTVSEWEEYSIFLKERLAGLRRDHTEQVLSWMCLSSLSFPLLHRNVPNRHEYVCCTSFTWTQTQKNSDLAQQMVKTKCKKHEGLHPLLPTRKASLNSKEHGNCLWSWCTQSNHCRKTGHLSFKSSAFSPWPQRSANLWPKSNHSVSTSTWKPWKRTGEFDYMTIRFHNDSPNMSNEIMWNSGAWVTKHS